MKTNRIPVLCISGPTASGKSAFALELAKSLNGEIINADSVQVYEGFDIGSAKPSKEELDSVVHHLVSHVRGDEHYSVGRFRKEAMSCILDISSRGKVPIVVGGTGLYIRGLFSNFLDSWGFSFGEEVLEKILEKISEEDHGSFLHQLLSVLDIETAKKFPVQDERRVRRSLVQILSSGVPLSALKDLRNAHISEQSEQQSEGDTSRDGEASAVELYPLIWIVEQNRQVLYDRINLRVEKMLESGWVSEVANLLKYLSPDSAPFLSLGYRHLSSLDYSSFSELPVPPRELIEEIKKDTRRFAKRQLTWWRNQPNVLDWKSVFAVCSPNPGGNVAVDDRPSQRGHAPEVVTASAESSAESSFGQSSKDAAKDGDIRGTREFCELQLKEFSRRFIEVIRDPVFSGVDFSSIEPKVFYGRVNIE